MYLQNAPIHWTSKKQAGVEPGTFGSEFTAMKQCTEYIRGLRYKLRMMGIPCDLPTFVYGDNQSVLCNTTIPGSTLKKKSHSLAYHFVCEGCARDERRTAYVNTHLKQPRRFAHENFALRGEAAELRPNDIAPYLRNCWSGLDSTVEPLCSAMVGSYAQLRPATPSLELRLGTANVVGHCRFRGVFQYARYALLDNLEY